MITAHRLPRPLLAALLPLALAAACTIAPAAMAQEPVAAPEPAASAPAPAAEFGVPASAGSPASAASIPAAPRCDKPGANRAANLVCALGFVRHSEAEHGAGHDDRAVADLAKADEFEPNDLRFAIAHAGMRLSTKGQASPERLRDALRETPDDVGLNMLHGEASLADHKYDDAIADATHAIALRPGAHAAYELRGTARFAKGDTDGANADVAQALTLAPKAPDALRLRASVTSVSGHYDDALADLQAAHRLEPRADDPFLIGGTQFLARRFRASAESLAKSSGNVGDGAYWLLWRYMALARDIGPEAARGSLGPGSIAGYTSPWPMSVIDFYLGRIDAEKVLADARAAQAGDDQSQVCEAHFYLGEEALLHFRREEALNLFRATLAECPTAFHEYVGAKAELDALTAQDAAVAAR